MLKYLTVFLVLASPAFAITKEEARQMQQEKIERAQAHNDAVTGKSSAKPSSSKSVKSGNTSVSSSRETSNGTTTTRQEVTVGDTVHIESTTTKKAKPTQPGKIQKTKPPHVGWNEYHQQRARKANKGAGGWNWH